MSYCTCNEIRAICGLSSDDIHDSTLADLRDLAVAQLNADIGYHVSDEEAMYISSEKKNTIDGSNKVFYLKEVNNNLRQVGDYNDDGVVNTSDVYAYTINQSGVRTAYTLTSLDSASLGKLTLSSAPTTSEVLYFSYVVFPISASSSLIKIACAQLAAAYAFTKIEPVKLQSYRIGKVSVTKQAQGFSMIYQRYLQTLDRINATALVDTATDVETTVTLNDE